jgi:nitric oxide dioxygenase
MSLTPKQIQIVRSTVPVLKVHGNEITTRFYKTLLDDIPELHNTFNTTNQTSGSQQRALTGFLCAYASHIDDLGSLSPAVESICQKHASLYVKPGHYKIVGKYLLRAMGDVLGAALTKETLAAWEAAYWQLASIMIAKEAQMMELAGEWTDWREFRIARKVKESDEITSFYLKPVDGKALPSYKPGQYLSVMTVVPKLNYMQPRQYSLSDQPNPESYRITVKREAGLSEGPHETVVPPGYVSNVLHDLKNEGDSVFVSHPAGDFYLNPETDSGAPTVLLSAAIGLTPMLSMLNTLLDRGPTQHISFIHGARNTSVQAFGEYIRNAAKQHPNLMASFFIDAPKIHEDIEGVHYRYTGHVRLGALDRTRDLCLDNVTTRYFICGPRDL